ncbi:MAG: serine/threonine protein kinase, partial [Phycisphaerales bacterium]|nr:serine/threonine protein kinase [Phycisphaerales bacterium]
GVHHAHVKGVIHCDLKPGNVLVAEGRPRIVDFGIARLVDERDGQTMDQAIGTPAYMSPEQVQGRRRDLDARTDVYALGVIIHEVMSGSLPYQADWSSMYDASKTICETPPVSLPGDLGAVVGQALEKDPDRRYQSAQALASDLRAVLEHRPVQAVAPSAMYQARLFAVRHRGLVVAIGVALLAVVAGLVGTTAFAIRASHLKGVAEDEREVAFQAQREAEAARASAERRFGQVRALATTLLFDIEGMLRFVSGATPARERLVAVGLQYLEGLAQEAGDDTILLDELSRGYLQVAMVQGAPQSSSLGDTEGGLASLDRAIDLRERQIELQGSDPGAMLWKNSML